MRALLDVNVLIALLDEAHIGHAVATRWMSGAIDQGWASCPITQNGCIRIMSQPAYPGALPVTDVALRLAEATQHDSHRFWPDDISLLEARVIDWQHVLGHRQVTDAYLMALAVRHQGQFVTFDGRVNLSSVAGASANHLRVLR
jgi:uncharacterized protein